MSDSDPKSTRRSNGTFTKGNTANRKGAPKRPPPPVFVSAFDVFQNERVTAADGTVIEISPPDARRREIYRAATKGSKKAARIVLKWIEKRDQARLTKAARRQKSLTTELLKEPKDPDNINEALLLLQIASLDESYLEFGHRRLQLEPWAVQAALGRRHGAARLDARAIKEVNYFTRAAETIRWPRGYHHPA